MFSKKLISENINLGSPLSKLDRSDKLLEKHDIAIKTEKRLSHFLNWI